MLKLRLQYVESRAAEDWSKFDAITHFETDIFWDIHRFSRLP